MRQIQVCLVLFFIFVIKNAQARLEGEGIIGGDDVKNGDYTYQVSLQIYGANICGGAIISDCHVVTAAHCLMDTNNKFARTPTLKVRAGTNNIFRSSSPHEVIVDVEDAFVPKEYDRSFRTGYTTGDIAVLKLKQCLNIRRNPNLRKLNLPHEDEKVDYVKAIVTGFGWNEVNMKYDEVYKTQREHGGRGYGKMRYAEASVMNNEDCMKSMGRITSKHLCAALVQRHAIKHEGVCSGDSGSPLAYGDTIIGVVSSSPTGCVENLLPAVYTRVSSFVSFIRRVMYGRIGSDIRHFKLSMYG